MAWHDKLIGLFVFFTVLNTITVGLRVLVRTKLTKGAFGWDDVALVFTYVGMVLFVGLSLQSLHYGKYAADAKPWHDETKAHMYYFAMCVVCFIISGTVKISVALVLYRLDNRPFMRSALILDIVTCSIWTVSTTLLVSLGCMERSPYYGIIDKTTCNNTTYSRESLQVIYDVLHVILPIMILWNVQISRGMKCSVVGLFSVELLAAGAAAIKLRNSYNGFYANGNVDYVARGYQAMIWSTVEHGLSTFGSSVLALRPLLKFISKGWANLSSNLYSSGSLSWGHKSSRRTSRESNWSDPIELSELGKISVRNEVSIRNIGMAECHLQQPVYLAKAYTGTSGTYNRLIDGESQGNVGRGGV